MFNTRIWVACVIAIRQAEKSGERLPTQGEGRGRIVYELEERAGELHMTRAIEFEGNEYVVSHG